MRLFCGPIKVFVVYIAVLGSQISGGGDKIQYLKLTSHLGYGRAVEYGLSLVATNHPRSNPGRDQ